MWTRRTGVPAGQEEARQAARQPARQTYGTPGAIIGRLSLEVRNQENS
jgi:hypothetical protein